MKLLILSIFLAFQVQAFFEVHIYKVEVIFQEIVDYSKLRVKKINKTTHAIAGNFSFFEDIGNQFEVRANIYKKQGKNF